MYKRQIIDKINEECLDKEVGKFYRYVNEKLYRLRKKEWKLYIPNSVSGEIIAEIHRMYGHLGSKKCTKMLQEHFTIDKMLKKVKNYLTTCDVCQKCKDTGNKVLFGGTKAIVPLGRGDLVSADYFGPLPVSSAGVRIFVRYCRQFHKIRTTVYT